MSARSAMLAVMSGARPLSLAIFAALALLGGACRDPDELAGSVTAILVVVDLEDDDVVELDIAGRALRAEPKEGDNLVAFNLPLPVGTHTGGLVVLQVEDDGEQPRDCGPVTIVVPAAAEPVLVAVGADDLGECPEVDDPEIEIEAEPEAEPEPDDGL